MYIFTTYYTFAFFITSFHSSVECHRWNISGVTFPVLLFLVPLSFHLRKHFFLLQPQNFVTERNPMYYYRCCQSWIDFCSTQKLLPKLKSNSAWALRFRFWCFSDGVGISCGILRSPRRSLTQTKRNLLSKVVVPMFWMEIRLKRPLQWFGDDYLCF